MPVQIIPYDNFHQPHSIFNVSIGDNSHINALNAQNATDNSSNVQNITYHEPFEQSRILIEHLNSQHKQELLELLSQIQQAKQAQDKKHAGFCFGKFLTLASIADCITVAQPIFYALSTWLFS